jgi:ATPase subunit of ABC transporter with duplicated ATPase domains
MSSQNNTVILRFDNVVYGYNEGKKQILDEASFSLRENTKITIMGQNGAGKSTMFQLITGELKPLGGQINIAPGTSIAVSRQVLPRDQYDLTLREYFSTAFHEKDYQLDKKIAEVLDAVNLIVTDYDKTLRNFSGGQLARLLLAHALIQKPDILLLDEPTNNLDKEGIGHLISFLLMYEKTVVVISHDADFLNMFTDGVLYLNIVKKKIEQYRGDYYDVVEQIAAQVEKEESLNARMQKEIQDSKEKINYFANKGGRMRNIAAKLKDEVAEAEENIVVVRKDDKTIKPFTIEFEAYTGPLVTINNISMMSERYEVIQRKLNLVVRKREHYLLEGPNGIGKSTLLKRLINAHDGDATIHDGVVVGYYSQDFAALDMDMIVWDALQVVSREGITDQDTYKVASQFLLTGDLLKSPIRSLSEGQKGLLCYARFVIQKPHLLILDEPSNHINFRHLPIIAESLKDFE